MQIDKIKETRKARSHGLVLVRADGKGNLRIYRAAARGGHRFTLKSEE